MHQLFKEVDQMVTKTIFSRVCFSSSCSTLVENYSLSSSKSHTTSYQTRDGVPAMRELY